MKDSNELDKRLRPFAEQLLVRWPQFAARLETLPGPKDTPNARALLLELGCGPGGQLELALDAGYTVEPDEVEHVTIWLNEHHEHCAPDRALDLLADIFKDKVSLLIELAGESYVDSRLARADEPAIAAPSAGTEPASSVAAKEPRGCLAAWFAGPPRRTLVRSWLGSCDGEL